MNYNNEVGETLYAKQAINNLTDDEKLHLVLRMIKVLETDTNLVINAEIKSALLNKLSIAKKNIEEFDQLGLETLRLNAQDTVTLARLRLEHTTIVLSL